jgi:hypothetical protein
MALAKLTATGDIHATNAWARPDVYEAWLAALGPADYRAVVDAMNADIDNRDVVRAQYVVCPPGTRDEWFDVYSPVYHAMNGSREMAGKFIGLILWEVMFSRPEQWYFQKIDKTIVNEQNLVEDIQVMEYFRGESFNAAAG